jgi:predicted Zn-dependent protease
MGDSALSDLGWLNAPSPEEAAGVIAHEVAHAELRHGLQGMFKSMGIRAVASMVLGDWSGALLQEGFTGLLEMKFSREAELKANSEGLRLLVAAQVDPSGMSSFMDKLNGKDQSAVPPEFLSTHPASKDLADRLKAASAAAYSPWTALPFDWKVVSESLPMRSPK